MATYTDTFSIDEEECNYLTQTPPPLHYAEITLSPVPHQAFGMYHLHYDQPFPLLLRGRISKQVYSNILRGVETQFEELSQAQVKMSLKRLPFFFIPIYGIVDMAKRNRKFVKTQKIVMAEYIQTCNDHYKLLEKNIQLSGFWKVEHSRNRNSDGHSVAINTLFLKFEVLQ